MPDYSLSLPSDGLDTHAGCPCWVLTQPLLPHERLPRNLKGVCAPTMRKTVAIWAHEQERWAGATVPWPYPYRRRAVALVIRQWAMESPNAAFARRLARNPSWRKLVAHLRQHADPLLESALVDWCMATILASEGFPATPPMVAHLRDVVNGAGAPALPARGVLCTTLVYADLSEPQAARFNDGSPDFHPSMPLEFMGNSRVIDNQIAAIRSATLKWLRSWKRSPLTSAGEVARASATAARSLTLDPLRAVDEDLAGIEVIEADVMRGMSLDEAIGLRVDLLGERLRGRRRRAKHRGEHVAALMPGWERQVRARLHALVLPRLQRGVTKCNRR